MSLKLEIEEMDVKGQNDAQVQEKKKAKKPSIALQLRDIHSVSDIWPTVHASLESDWDVVAIEEAKEDQSAAAGVEGGEAGSVTDVSFWSKHEPVTTGRRGELGT